MSKKNINADDQIAVILKAIDEIKGVDVQIMDLREIENTVCDYFIICSGTSNTIELMQPQTKEVLKIIDMMGRETKFIPNTPLIYIYSDGTKEKVMKLKH